MQRLHADTCLGHAANDGDLDCACDLAPRADVRVHTSDCIATAHATGNGRCTCIELFPVVVDSYLAFIPGSFVVQSLVETW